MNARTIRTAALVTLFALSAPAFAAAGDGQKQDTRKSQTEFAEYVPTQLDDARLSAIGGGDAARAPEKNPHVGDDLTQFQRFIRWMVVLRL